MVKGAADMELRCREERHIGHRGAEDMPPRDPQRGQEILVCEQFWILRAGAGLDVGVERHLRDIGGVFRRMLNQLAVGFDGWLANEAKRAQD